MSIGLSDPDLAAAAPVRDAAIAHAVSVLPVVDRPLWDDLTGRLPFPHLPQSYAYGEGKSAKGWHVVRAAFRRGDRILAIATMLERRFFGLRLLTRVNRGPVFLDAAPGPDDVRDVHAALRRHWRGPLLIAPALPHGAGNAALLREAGFRLRHDHGWRSGRIDLSPSEDQLWSGFGSTFRNRVRQAQKLGASLRISGDAESYEWMMAQHVHNMAEKGFKAADAVLLRSMREAAAKDVLVFQLVHEGRPVAGMSVVQFGRCAEYHIGWFGPEGRKLNAGNFLMWEIVKAMKRRGALYFDVGGLREGDGYTRFKRTMKPIEYRLAGEWMSL